MTGEETSYAQSSSERRRSSWAARLMVILAISMVIGVAGAVVIQTPVAGASPTGAPMVHATSSRTLSAPKPSVSASKPSEAKTPLPNSLPPNVQPHLAPFHLKNLPSHLPQSWGGSPIPPGAPTPVLASARTSSGQISTPSSSWSAYLQNWCAGLWPSSNNQNVYYPGCYGHDEPGIQGYSDLNGSGGNVTWNVTLPVDRSNVDNQSDIYVAIWFGMSLSDPYAWMDQCFLELQFYPDSTWGAPSYFQNGIWAGAAVAWQIQASTGAEDPCFFQPLYVHNNASLGYFYMQQGDTISVTMSGWTHDPYGENITITDVTQNVVSNVTLFNKTGNYPLDPAYVTNTYQNGLEWTPGGEFPVVFAFETGHCGSGTCPENNSYGGCSAGDVLPSSPCPSYMPGAWSLDTLSPWYIKAPTFFNATAQQTATQIAFSQDFGGVSAINTFSEGTCFGLTGSQYCSYPWYSYSCSQSAFSFGATDWPTTTEDFGKYMEYNPVGETNAMNLEFFPPANYSIPTCGAHGDVVNASAYVSGTGASVIGGTVSFLNTQAMNVTMTVVNGTYSISALPSFTVGTTTYQFSRWAPTPNLHVSWIYSPVTSLTVMGSGNVVATYVTTGIAKTSVTFLGMGAGTENETFTLVPGQVFPGNPTITAAFTNPIQSVAGIGWQPGTITITNNTTVALAPGIYTIQANPYFNYIFTSWTSSNDGGLIAAWEFPFTWLTVTGAQSSVNVMANFAPAPPLSAQVTFMAIPQGAAHFELGTTPVYTSGAGSAYNSTDPLLTLPAGTYNVSAMPNNGWAFLTWFVINDGVMTNLSETNGLLTLEPGMTVVYAYFEQTGNVTVTVSPAGQGAVIIDSQLPVSAPTTFPYAMITVPLLGNQTVPIWAFPAPNYVFSNWYVSNASLAQVMDPMSPYTMVMLNTSSTVVTLQANFTTTTTVVPLKITTGTGPNGAIWNGVQPIGGTTNVMAALGYTYLLFSNVSVLGVNTAGPVSVMPYPVVPNAFMVTVDGTGASITLVASTSPMYVPLTFVSTQANATAVVENGPALSDGMSAMLPLGSTDYLNLTVAPGGEFVMWTSSDPAAITFSNALSAHTNVTVGAAGTVYAIVIPPLSVSNVVLENETIGLGQSTMVSVQTAGSGTTGLTYTWSAPAGAGCAPANAPAETCTPSAAGLYDISVSVTNATGYTVSSGISQLAVIAFDNVTLSANDIMVGQTTQITVNLQGGTPQYRLVYDFMGLPPGCAATAEGLLNATVSCTPAASGTFPVTVTIWDLAGVYLGVKGNFTLNVLIAPQVSIVSPTPDFQYSGPFVLNVTWSTTVGASSDLSQITESISVINAFGEYLNKPGDTRLVFVSPAATETYTMTFADINPALAAQNLPVGEYTLNINVTDTATGALLGAYSTTFGHSEAAITSPSNGAVVPAGNVTIGYTYARIGATVVTLSLYSAANGTPVGSAIFSIPVINPTGFGVGSTVQLLSTGSYFAEISTFDGSVWYNASAVFSVVAPTSSGVVYKNTTYSNTTSGTGTLGIPVDTLGAILIVIGIVIGLIVAFLLAAAMRPRAGVGGPQPWEGESAGKTGEGGGAGPGGGTTSGTHECTVCNTTFPDEASLEEHKKTAHNM
jgi:hypothetical protein